MVYTSDRPISVDGVRLDTLAWNITRISRATAGRRAADVTVPGVDGALPSLNDSLEPGSFGLDMFVRGATADGLVPVAGPRSTLRTNLDELIHLFGKRHALLEVRDTVDVGVERRAWAKVTDVIAPDVNETGSVATFTVGMTLPYGVWEDVDTQDWTSGVMASGQGVEVGTLRGATERIQDAVILVQGPASAGLQVRDNITGAYAQLNRALAANEQWRLNCATWASRYGTTLTLGSADTTGTDATAVTLSGGTLNSGSPVPLVPYRNAGIRIVGIQLVGAGITTATRVSVRARRKYAL